MRWLEGLAWPLAVMKCVIRHVVLFFRTPVSSARWKMRQVPRARAAAGWVKQNARGTQACRRCTVSRWVTSYCCYWGTVFTLISEVQMIVLLVVRIKLASVKLADCFSNERFMRCCHLFESTLYVQGLLMELNPAYGSVSLRFDL